MPRRLKWQRSLMGCSLHPDSLAVTPRAHSGHPTRTEQMKEWTIKDYGRGHPGNGGGPDIAAMAGDANENIAGQVADVYPPRAHAGSIEYANVGGLVRDSRRHGDAVAGRRQDVRSYSKIGYGRTRKPVTILLVDDDKVDAMAIKRSFQELCIENPVIEARNGIEALERLRGQNGYEQVPSPCLILLDLNMPRMDGIEFLGELRRDPSLRRLLVFVMTTSSAEEDRKRAYDQNVAGYVLKSRPGHGFVESIETLQHYWRAIEFPD
jgi:CheY-like chemotaxis protein